jgi:DNA-binding MarR family transcriptional regulator
MSSEPRTDRRRDLIAAFVAAARRSSTTAVLFHGAVAERFGLSPTDAKALEILDRRGPLTAGELAAETGLAKTSVTSLIDRLEEKHFVRRVRDPRDRRSVIVEPNPKTLGRLTATYQNFHDATLEVLSRYTDDQLETITDFLTRGADVATRTIEALSRSLPKR